MSEETKIGRRGAMKRALTVLGAAAVAPTLLAAAGCGSEEEGLTCTDTSGLTPPQIATRESQAYVDATANPNEKCSNCNFYTAGQPNACGSCSVIGGPIHPDGYCNLWAAAPS